MVLNQPETSIGNPAERQTVENLLQTAASQARSGDVVTGRATFLRAADTARQAGDPAGLARAALGYGGRFVWIGARTDPYLVPLLEEALAGRTGADEALGIRLRARLSCASPSSAAGDTEAASLADEAVLAARKLNDAATLSFALMCAFWSRIAPDNHSERLRIAREMLVAAEAAADEGRIFDAHQALFVTFGELGMISEAKAHLVLAAQSTHEPQDPAELWAAHAYEAVLALLEGDLDRASVLVELDRPAPGADPGGEAAAIQHMHRFLLRREQGRLGAEEAGLHSSSDDMARSALSRIALTCALLDLDRVDEARTLFEPLANDELVSLTRDGEWLLAMSLASECCARLGLVTTADTLYRLLLPFAGRHALAHVIGSAGAVDRYLGLLAQVVGRVEDAERHLDDAIRVNERMGALPWVARAQFDLAEVLRQRAMPGDGRRSQELLGAARDTAQRLGLASLLRLLAAEPESKPAKGDASGGSAKKGTFRQEGEYWTVGLGGLDTRVRDSKGMHYLALLLGRPGAEMHVLDLVGTARGPDLSTRPGQAAPAELDGTGFGDAGEILDTEARDAYRERLRELDSEIAEAESWNDPEREDRLRTEREFLIRELSAAVGLGGRSRVASSAAERARLNVGKAIRSSIQRIDEHNPALGGHLGVSVHTGTFCSYVPDPGLLISWDL